MNNFKHGLHVYGMVIVYLAHIKGIVKNCILNTRVYNV